MQYMSIEGHIFRGGNFILNIRYRMVYGDQMMKIPFEIFKEDRPQEVAKYIRDNVMESRRDGRYSWWFREVLRISIRLIITMRRWNYVDQ